MEETQRAVIRERKEVTDTFKKELIKRLDLPYEPDDIHEDVSLLGAGLGLDSLDALEIVMAVENSFGIKIPEGNTEVLRSVNTIIDFIMEQKKTGATE
ncbi:MAG: acyl carrier protein [Chitinivibrionales bacterium]